MTQEMQLLELTFEEVVDLDTPNPPIGGPPQEKKKETYKSRTYLILMVLNIALSSFYYGYCMVYFAQMKIETMLDILNINSINKSLAGGLLNGVISIGALFGALLSSFLIKYFSRRYLRS